MDNNKNDHYYLDKIKTDLAFIVYETLKYDIPDLLEQLSEE